MEIDRRAFIATLGGTAAVDVDWVSHYHVEHEPSVQAWLASRD